jgi:hypothetical protein
MCSNSDPNWHRGEVIFDMVAPWISFEGTMDESPDETNATAAVPISWDKRYDTAKELFFATLVRQFEYGKWVLASLLAVHAGSLIAIAQAGDKKSLLYQACGEQLIYGLSTALVAGGFAWVNFTVASNVYGHRVFALRKGEEPKEAAWKTRVVNGTMYLAVFAAIGSLVLFLIAATRVTEVLK